MPERSKPPWEADPSFPLELVHALFEALPEPLLLVGPDLVVSEANQALCRLFDTERGETLGRPVYELLPGIESVPQLTESLLRTANQGQAFDLELAQASKGGRRRALRFLATSLGEGTQRRVLLRITEVTKRAALDAGERARLRHEAMGELSGRVAHDLNNLLVGVLGNAGLALMDLPPHSPATKHVERIEEVGKRVAKLLQKLLAYSGMGRLVVRPIDVSELIQGLARSMESAVSEKAQLRFELESGLPQVDADPAELKRVVRNLVENASEALGDEGGLVVVRTGVRKETRSDLARYWPRGDRAGGTYVYLEVSDTGCGMKAESIPQVFDPFFTTKFAGRGLGLCEVLGIVRAHRGAIRLESEPGLGTTVRVLLPTPGGLVAGPERDGTKRELER